MASGEEALQELRELGWRVEEHPEIVEQGPTDRSAAYLVAERAEGGFRLGLAYRPGLSEEQLVSLCDGARQRFASLLSDGPDGPYSWQEGVHVPGYYSWIGLYDLDPSI